MSEFAGELVNDFLERLARGERPDVEEYAARYPGPGAVLRHMLPVVRAIHPSAADHAQSTEHPELKPEAPLGDFRVLREIGRGRMGIVYEAVQVSLGRRVALKVLPFVAALDARQLQRFKNEAQAAAQLRERLGLSQEEFADKAGIHRTYVSSIELGKVQVSIGIAQQLAAALESPLSKIWAEVEKEHR